MEETTINLKRPASLTKASSNPPSPKYDSSQENNVTLKPPKKVLIIESKSDSKKSPSITETRPRSANSRNRFSEHLHSHLGTIKHY